MIMKLNIRNTKEIHVEWMNSRIEWMNSRELQVRAACDSLTRSSIHRRIQALCLGYSRPYIGPGCQQSPDCTSCCL